MRRPLVHPFGDTCAATVSAPALEELFAERMAALAAAPRVRDLFDLWFALSRSYLEIDRGRVRALAADIAQSKDFIFRPTARTLSRGIGRRLNARGTTRCVESPGIRRSSRWSGSSRLVRARPREVRDLGLRVESATPYFGFLAMPDNSSQIHECEHRQDVQVRFPDGRVLCGPAGARLEDFVRAAMPPQSIPVVAALVNGRLADLTEPLITDVDVEPVSLSSEDGMRIYQRSLTLLMEAAARELFQVHMDIDYSLTFGGLYCHALEGELTERQVAQIEARMRAIFSEDAPIGREVVSIADAIAYFKAQGDDAQARFLAQAVRPQVTLCTLHGIKEYFFGRLLVPSAGYLKQYAVWPDPPGLVLQFPQRSRPIALEPPKRSPKLTAVIDQYGKWLSLLGVPDVAALNAALNENRSREIVLVAEALHEQRIAEMAANIAARRTVRLITIAGPSSSGKTTFARRLAIQLLANGLRPFPISLDDYFVSREETPRDAAGNYDYEDLHALDLALFNEQLLALMNGERVTLPRYNFGKGDREGGESVRLSPEHVLLIEGIHGLDPNLVPRIPTERIYRIYVSALTQLKLGRLNRIATTDTRLIRRIVRDARTRGYGARETIARWDSVRSGEDRNIFPYQEQADSMFNSALVYELAVLKPLVEPLLRQVEPGTPEYVEARRLLILLEWFNACDTRLVPESSILREFIGGSVVSDFVPHL